MGRNRSRYTFDKTTKDIAYRLVALWREGKIEIAQKELYACALQLDVTIKGHGRMNLDELCIYEVKDGKIVSEQFTSRLRV